MLELSATAKVILGLLSHGPQSGYDVKQAVDRSTRFFWSASYGQIYPELKRLEKAGLVTGADEATGDRARRAYRLTPAGEQALHDWLLEAPAPPEMRHEALLKVFFSNPLEPADRASKLSEMRDGHRDKLAQLRAVEASLPEQAADDTRLTALRFGIDFNDWVVAWCDATLRDLEQRGT